MQTLNSKHKRRIYKQILKNYDEQRIHSEIMKNCNGRRMLNQTLRDECSHSGGLDERREHIHLLRSYGER
jgi:hypothetical protein